MAEVDGEILQAIVHSLQDVATAVSSQQSFTAKWLPAFVGALSAVAALLVGVLSFFAAKSQIRVTQKTALAQIDSTQQMALAKIRADLVAASRKTWIDDLRNHVSNIIAHGNQFHHRFRLKQKVDEDVFTEFWVLEARVRLMLNSDKPTHKRLTESLSGYIGICGAAASNPDIHAAFRQLTESKEELIKATEAVLRPEWKRVASLE